MFAPTEIITTPVLFRHLVKNLRRRHALDSLSTVRRIVLSQGIVERPTYELARRACPHAVLLPRYGATETGFVGVACPTLAKATLPKYAGMASALHPLPPVRIKDPDERGVGEIIVKRGSAWIHTGDTGTLLRGRCACGERRTLVLHGRMGNDRIACVGAMFLAPEIERVAASLSGYIRDYRIAIGESGARKPKGLVQLRVVPTAALRKRRDAAAFIAGKFAGALRVTKSRTLGELIRESVFLPMRVEFVDEFPVTAKPIKLMRLLAR